MRKIEESLDTTTESSRVMAEKLVRAHEDERRKIAHELHDAFGQDLVTVLLEMNRLMSYCKTSNDLENLRSKVCAVLEKLSLQVGEIATAISDFSHQLHPIMLERKGLCHAIAQLCKDIDITSKIRVHFSSWEPRTAISSTVSLCLYRIVQESLHNVQKHAHASCAEVHLEQRGNWVNLTVRDNGVGYNPAKLRPEAGLGVANMNEHTVALGGSFAVSSAPGHGTQVSVRLPIQNRS
ncbi:MAG TPA: sensor histidine kinase [Terriglobia bacterium]|nr:sensor histidine kinase [Terriglobia bacterium]